MISNKSLEVIATAVGYEDERDYAQDNAMSQCEDCGNWGKDGEQVHPIPVGEYDVEWVCSKCLRLRDAEARTREPIGG